MNVKTASRLKEYIIEVEENTGEYSSKYFKVNKNKLFNQRLKEYE